MSQGTASVRSKCKNLKEFRSDNLVDMRQIIEKIAAEYWHKHSSSWSIEHLFIYYLKNTIPWMLKKRQAQ